MGRTQHPPQRVLKKGDGPRIIPYTSCVLARDTAIPSPLPAGGGTSPAHPPAPLQKASSDTPPPETLPEKALGATGGKMARRREKGPARPTKKEKGNITKEKKKQKKK